MEQARFDHLIEQELGEQVDLLLEVLEGNLGLHEQVGTTGQTVMVTYTKHTHKNSYYNPSHVLIQLSLTRLVRVYGYCLRNVARQPCSRSYSRSSPQ